MKRTLLAAGILLALATVKATAQEQGFHAGLTTGYYYTTILDKGLFDSPTYDHKTSFSSAPVGFAAGYQWEGGNGIQVELIRANMEQKFDINHIATTGGEYTTIGEKEINLRYWQLPVLFKMQNGEGKARFTFMFGPQISFLSKAQDIETFNQATINYEGNHVETVTPGLEYLIGSTNENGRYAFNNMAVGGLVGFGADIYFNENVYLSANLRAGYNFTEIREEEGGVKFADTYKNTHTPPVPPTETEDALYKRELRTAAFGGLQVGIHYMFGQ